jgi:hypothetical protein
MQTPFLLENSFPIKVTGFITSITFQLESTCQFKQTWRITPLNTSRRFWWSILILPGCQYTVTTRQLNIKLNLMRSLRNIESAIRRESLYQPPGIDWSQRMESGISPPLKTFSKCWCMSFSFLTKPQSNQTDASFAITLYQRISLGLSNNVKFD